MPDRLVRLMHLEDECESRADAIAAREGLELDRADRKLLTRAVAMAMKRASMTLAREADARFGRASGHAPRQADAHGTRGEAQAVAFSHVLSGWEAEKRPTRKTVYEWTRVINELVAFLGHDDAARVRPEDLIAWKESLLQAGRRPKTIRDAKLAPVRAILQWATDNRRLPKNPAERIAMEVRVKAGEGRRSYTDDEAKLILRAALQEQGAVRRWVPWLCCYSGARLSEVCQLRAEDIVQVEGIWCMRFDPSAGPLKTRSSERAVPVHPALIDGGFLDFFARVRSGPLFPELPPDIFGSRGGNGTKVLGRWIRKLGLVDPRLSPNHSWRHRLKTLARRHGLALDLVDAMTGHARRTVADTYGEFPMPALYRELTKIPALELS
jgi:integrase